MGKKSIYSQEFKAEAVELARRKGFKEAANDLGINPANIRRWDDEMTNPKSTSIAELEKENKRLRKENEYIRKINEVLKKSTAIFSQDHYPSSMP